MLGHRELTMEDYAGILKRRFWLILISAIPLLAVGIGVSYIIPPQYMSQTLVLIEQQKVPEDYVKPVVNEDLDARLASMKEQILSRSRIEPIIERFNLYAGSKATMDDRVEMTQKAIGIKPIPSGNRAECRASLSPSRRRTRAPRSRSAARSLRFLSARISVRARSPPKARPIFSSSNSPTQRETSTSRTPSWRPSSKRISASFPGRRSIWEI